MKSLINKIKKCNKETYDDFIDYLCNIGFMYHSDGCFSQCFAKKKSKYILKIFDVDDDIAYYFYLKEMQEKKSKHFPKIFNTAEIILDDRKYCIVIMEKLLSCYDIPFYKYRDLIAEHFNIHVENIDDDVSDDFRNWFRNTDKFNIVIDVICDIMKKLDNVILDLHKENIMFRKEKNKYVPIFIDTLMPV